MKLSAIAAVLAILLAPLFSRADGKPGKPYTVLIQRPHKVGDKASFESVYAADDTATFDTASEKPTTREVTSGMHLIVDAEIMEVDNRGHTTVEESTIRTFTRIDNNTETPILQPGQKVRGIAWEPQAKFTIDGKPATESLTKLLNQFLPIIPPGRGSPDDIFGTSTSRRVGDSWPINADRMSASFLDTGYQADSKNISGTVRLVSVESYENQPCLRLQADFTIKHLMPTTQHAQKEYAQKPGWNLQDADRTYRLVWLLPLDLTQHILFTSNERTIENHWTESRGGRTINVDQSAKTEYDFRVLDH